MEANTNQTEQETPTLEEREVANSAVGEVEAFDLNAIRMTPDNMVGDVAEKLLTTVPVQKPNKHAFIRVHPDPDYRIDTAVFQLDGEREYYLVPPYAQSYFPTTPQLVTLYTAITRAGGVFLWPARFPDDSRRGGGREWHKTARAAAEKAQTSWIRIEANQAEGRYEIYRSKDILENPVFPEYPFDHLVKLAFDEDRIVDRPDHPVIRILEGRANAVAPF